MSDRFPSGSLNAVCKWLHSQFCYDAATDPNCAHSWRDHSGGAPYRKSARTFIDGLNESGFMIVRRER